VNAADYTIPGASPQENTRSVWYLFLPPRWSYIVHSGILGKFFRLYQTLYVLQLLGSSTAFSKGHWT